MSTRQIRVFAHGLLFAMLLAVLAPAISRALASTHTAGDWKELCTSQGMRWVPLAAEGAGTESVGFDDLLHALDDCGHCVLTGERFAPLQPSRPVLPEVDGFWGVPLRHAASPCDLDTPSPWARGPPSLG